MNKNDIFVESHGRTSNVLIPVTLFDGKFEIEELGFQESYKEKIDILKQKIPQLVDHIYFIPNQFIHHFCYYKDNVWQDLFSLEWENFENFHQLKQINYAINATEQALKDNDYESLFSFMEKKILIERFIALYNEIPKEQRYDVFRDIWVRSEFGFYQFSHEMLEEIFKLRIFSKARKEAMQKLRNEVESDTLTIYRGVTDESTPYNIAISWTLDEKVAHFFATRFSSFGDIYKAEVDINDVWDYIYRRSEEEILVNPNKLINVELHKSL